ncbi:unnamed protein product [Kluyveromyces dobzhanskii CBS 2104]|uniref:WGS project CCBQ000000000 data, contig 00106 n=1 Tax=Kluyveromyces dobzhanskii CBS 2104 TaxID=1427455 RepID=A0A0A8L628_9SACH|nr:unnamed protein product [Kluyveromyces dobzhanskii CBS 2104]
MNSAPRDIKVEELKQPIGLESPPFNTKEYKYGNSFLDLFNSEKTGKRAEELEVEFRKSGFHDLYVLEKTNGKIFLSPPSYWKADKSLYLPHLVGQRLSDDKECKIEDTLKGKISILRLFTTDVGKKQIDSYFIDKKHGVDYYSNDEHLLREQEGMKPAQIVEVNLGENWIKTMIVKMVKNRYSSVVPPHRHDRTFICNRDQLPFQIREQIQINNLYSGYVLIVDENLKIRWAACGEASQKEFNLLWKCVKAIRCE